MTQSDISNRLGLTRLKVSRLLEKGHQSGIIRVQINSRFEGCLEYETELRRRFDLNNVRSSRDFPARMSASAWGSAPRIC